MASTTILIGICIYFMCIIFVGYLMRSKNKGAEDFLVGGRSFGLLFNSGTLAACWLGGVLIIGVPGTLYAFGYWDSEAGWGAVVSLGSALCLVIAGFFYMKRLWQLKLLSLGDFYYKRFGKTAGGLATILMCFTFTLWIAVQIIAFAKVGASLIGFSLSMWIIISMAVICTYTILGGLWAVCLTDIIQVSIVTISMLILTPVAVSMVGGWDAFVAAFPTQKLDIFPAEKNFDGFAPWLAAWLIVGFGSIASPDLMQRAFSAKSGKIAKYSAFCAAGIFMLVLVIITILTFATVQMMELGAVDSSFLEDDPELLIPMVFQQLMPAPLVIIFLGAVLAAVMSAAATANIALAGVISKNLIKDMFVPDMSSYTLMQVTRFVVLCVGIIAVYFAIELPSAYLLASMGFDLILSCLFVPLTLGLYWKKANGYGAVAGMIGGALFRIVGAGLVNGFNMEGIGSPTDTWYYFTLGGPVASLICMVVISLLSQKASAPIELEMEANVDEQTENNLQQVINN